MVRWNDSLEMFSNNRPSLPIVVQSQNTDELLEVIMKHGVVHAGVYAVEIMRDDAVVLDSFQCDAC